MEKKLTDYDKTLIKIRNERDKLKSEIRIMRHKFLKSNSENRKLRIELSRTKEYLASTLTKYYMLESKKEKS